MAGEGLKKRAARGLAWQVLALGVQAVVQLVFIMVLGRLVSPESFGTMALLSVFMLFVEKFTEFGFGAALIQRASYNERHVSFAFYTTVLVSGLVYVGVWLASPWIGAYYSFSPVFLQVIGALLLLKSVGVVSQSLVIRDLEFKKLFYVLAVSNVVGNLVVGIGLASWGYEIWALIWAQVCTHGLATVIVVVLKPHKLRLAFGRQEAYDILRFGTGLTLLRMFNQLGMQVDKLIVGKFFAKALLGFYERSLFIVGLPKVYLGKSLDSVMFSAMSRIKDDVPKVRAFFFRYMGVVSLMMLFFALILAFYPAEVLRILLGERWASASEVLRVLAVMGYLMVFTRFSDTLIRAKDALYTSSVIKFIFAGLVAALIFGLLQFGSVTYDLEGIVLVAWMMVIAMVVHAVMIVWLCLRLLSAKWGAFWGVIQPTLILGLLLSLKNVLWMALCGVIWGVLNDLVLLLGSVLLDGVVILALLWYLPAWLGRENIRFVLDLIKHVPGGKKLYNMLPVAPIEARLAK